MGLDDSPLGDAVVGDGSVGVTDNVMANARFAACGVMGGGGAHVWSLLSSRHGSALFGSGVQDGQGAAPERHRDDLSLRAEEASAVEPVGHELAGGHHDGQDAADSRPTPGVKGRSSVLASAREP